MCFPLPRDASRLIGKTLIALLNCHRRPICPNHVVSSRKGFSRALSHELQHSWKLTPARWSRPIACQMPMSLTKGTGEGWPWGKERALVPDFMCSKSFAAASKKIGGVFSEGFRPQLRHLHTGGPQ